ncbi:MAG: hypothetical protein OEZ10_12080 [Gammaproteobacteria bacterium]|nr:hypothetical protein [Gammaproteobacteria bacterium]
MFLGALSRIGNDGVQQFNILIISATHEIDQSHHCMPVMLLINQAREWLDATGADSF